METPAPFIEEVAKKSIDAGADIFIGHGPHVLRGIEIYKRKPIFYSLGNFIFQNDLIKRQPADLYEKYGLDWNALPADLYDARERGRPDSTSMGFKWFTEKPEYWESILIYSKFDQNEPKKIKLYPLELGLEKNRANRGRPFLASGKKAEKILTDISKLSEKYQTKIIIKDNYGIIEL